MSVTITSKGQVTIPKAVRNRAFVQRWGRIQLLSAPLLAELKTPTFPPSTDNGHVGLTQLAAEHGKSLNAWALA